MTTSRRPEPRRADAAFAPHAREVARAREFVAATLAAWGLDDVRTAMELAVSELVSNAIQHGAGDVRVSLGAEPGCMRLEVQDEGGGTPVMSDSAPGTGQVGGWGLRFVDELADAWGTESRRGLTRVWLDKRTGDGAPGAGPGPNGQAAQDTP